MTYALGTSVPQMAATGALQASRAGAVIYTMTLHSSCGCPVFKMTARAGSPEEAGAQAQTAYADILIGIGEQRDLTVDIANLVSDPAQTTVAPSHTPESIKIGYSVRDAGEAHKGNAARGCFRTSDATGRPRALRQRLGYRETIRQPLVERWSAGSHAIPSATLRALRRTQGPRRPDLLIAWLRDRGHASLATALEGELGR
jgi:hypothetical protein